MGIEDSIASGKDPDLLICGLLEHIVTLLELQAKKFAVTRSLAQGFGLFFRHIEKIPAYAF